MWRFLSVILPCNQIQNNMQIINPRPRRFQNVESRPSEEPEAPTFGSVCPIIGTQIRLQEWAEPQVLPTAGPR